MRKRKKININEINMDRWPFDTKSLKYANALANGAIFPPIKVGRIPQQRFQILDGRHRLLAHKLNGKKQISARFSTRVMQHFL